MDRGIRRSGRRKVGRDVSYPADRSRKEPAPLERIALYALGIADSEDQVWIRNRFSAWIAAAGTLSLEEAFSVTPRGGITAFQAARLEQRDRALQTLGTRFFVEGSFRHRANEIHRALCRYASSTWRLDRVLNAAPSQYANTAHALFFGILSAHDAIPSARHIRRVLRLGQAEGLRLAQKIGD
jgi:hypothetical protein